MNSSVNLTELKTIYDISVVVVTVGRDSLLRAIRSIFRQKFEGRIQILIGIDVDIYGNYLQFKSLLEIECPKNIDILWLHLPYSTSKRHGGVHDCFYGGALRSILTLLAHSCYVAYLDDDDWFLPEHLENAYLALNQYPEAVWAYAYCYYADSNSETILCLDEIESVGVGCGMYAENYGGFVRPSALIVNKLKMLSFLHLWSMAGDNNGGAEDRLLFHHLKEMKHINLGVATVCYALDPKDIMHNIRMRFISEKIGSNIEMEQKLQSLR